jgi:peptidoglycan-N-acetylglucosamine deacetylase
LNFWITVVSAGALSAAGVAAWGVVGPPVQVFGPTLRCTADAKKLALTFDDGPNPAVTSRLLDLFDRYSARVTFFLVGKYARACPDLVREMAVRGHVLGNHTQTHPNLIFLSRARIRQELVQCQQAIADATRSDPPRWMRPPYGFRSPALDGEVRRAGLSGVVMWSLICGDWKPQPPDRLIVKLARAARASSPRGDIVVLHDGDHRALGGDRAHVVSALENWLPRWNDAGIEFVTIDSVTSIDLARAHSWARNRPEKRVIMD